MNIHGIWCVMARHYPYKPIFACATREAAEQLCRSLYQPLTEEYEQFIVNGSVIEVPFVEVVDGLKLTADDENE